MRLCILLSIWLASVASEDAKERESRLVQINSGLVRGYKDAGEDIFVFHGIPYATAPTGTQRFKAPLPPPTWFHVFEAVDEITVCPQIRVLHILPESKVMKEDCLIANVYVPNTKEKNLPVVVYVHGGAFLIGYGDFVTPKKLVSSQNVIAVTFNYRLGAHGFLCLGTQDVPGNAGMKDQVALLRWVKKNIVNFGGNPNEVTIAGYSAGSASVDILMISKMAEGLFNKVIPESGASLSPFSLQIDPIQNAKEYAKLIDFDNVDDITELEEYFKTVSYEILQSGNTMNRKDSTILVEVCVERDNGQEMFLKENPLNILKRGDFPKLPMLYGFSSLEGLMSISLFEIWKEEINENFESFLPVDLHFKTEEEKDSVINSIKKFYFGDKSIDNNTTLEYLYFISDTTFACPTLRVVDLLVEAGHNKLYLYQYSYTEESTPVVPNTNVRGANHCSQTNTVMDGLDVSISTEFYDSEDYNKMRVLLRELWGSFIRKGKPMAEGVPEWRPVGSNWSPYMDLQKVSEMKEKLLEERCLFWNKIYDTYYKFPIPPSHKGEPIHGEL